MAATRSAEHGAILIHVAVALVVLMAFTTFVVDYGVLWVARGQAQNAADAAALAGAVAVAFDDGTDLTDTGPVKQSAYALSQSNFVWGESPNVRLATDITFPVCPDGTNTCLRVDVYRNQDRGNPLPVFFGALIGLTQQGIQATATTEVRAANASDCLKPWAIPDKWVENYPVPGPWVPGEEFNKYEEPNGPPLPNPDIYIPPDANQPGTGFTLEADYGTELLLKPGNPNAATSPGWFFPLQLTEPGAAEYEESIVGCSGTVWGVGDEIPVEPGNMIGPTVQGVRDLIDLDPYATWDPVSESVVGSCSQQSPPSCPGYTRSPRIVVVPVFDTGAYEDGRQTGRLTVRVVNILGFFIASLQGNDVRGYLVTGAGLLDAGNGNLNGESSFAKNIVLLR
jgi:Flp pilus assembly protein TadG